MEGIRFINCRFIKSASKASEFILDELPQVAIVGRSNVGKSSLINMLTNNSKMAKTSSMPGRTRLVNYFNVNNQFYLVDLPGYGFAKAAKNTIETWDAVMNDYFVSNDKLKLVLLLVDSRIGLQPKDLEMLNYLNDNDLPVVVVLTKTDKINRSETNKIISDISSQIRYDKSLIIPTSSSKKIGSESIAKLITARLT